MKTSCLLDGKLSLKMNEPQVAQRHQDMKRKWEYYHIITFLERIRKFTSRKKRTSEHHSDKQFKNIRDLRFAGSDPTEVDGFFFQDVKILSTSPPGGTLSWGSRI